MRTAAVLGCGPTGLVAAHAFATHGWDITIYSKRRKSEMFGAQYLHKPIPGATSRAPVRVSYQLRGSVDDYRRKVYGLTDDVEVSPQTLEEEHWAWDIRDTYNVLWEEYWDRIVDVDIDPSLLDELTSDGFDQVVSSVPAWPVLCRHRSTHNFRSEEIWAAGDAPERGVFLPDDLHVDRNTIVCSGDPSDRWYRVSNVFGMHTAEWPVRGEQPMPGASMVMKPIDTDCDCYPNIMRVGRYGEWRKGVLVHDAWDKVLDMIIDAA